MPEYGLVMVKREWVPEWVWRALCFISGHHVWFLHRWLCRERSREEMIHGG